MDKCHSKYGKARPWLVGGAIPLGVSGILLFFIPETGGWLPYAYFFVFYLIYNAVSYTIVMLSYNAMNALITKIDSERVTMNVASYTIVLFANILINSLTLGTVEALGNTVSAWRIVMTIFTTAGTILILLSGLTVKELPQDNETAPSTTTLPKNSLANDLQRVFKNPLLYLGNFICCRGKFRAHIQFIALPLLLRNQFRGH